MNQQDIKDIIVKIDEICKFITNSVQEENKLKANVKKFEDRQQDILHELEFNELHRKPTILLAREIKNLRNERRIAKELMELLEPFSQQVKSKSTTSSNLLSIATRVRDILTEQSNRTYVARQNGSNVSANSHYTLTQMPNNKIRIHKRKVK